jgi:hypothetical protein
MFFSVSRESSSGEFLYKESECISLLGVPAPTAAAGGASAAAPSAPDSLPMTRHLSGLQLLLLLMRARWEAHSFNIPRDCKGLLGRGGSACVFELPGDRAAKVYNLQERWVEQLKQNEAAFLREHLPQILASATDALTIQVDGSVSLGSRESLPPFFVSLVEELDNCLVLSPVCEKLSRERFNTCGCCLQVVVDIVNALRLLHIGGWDHGDVRRSNIVMKDGRGVLIDFAFAAQHYDAKSLNAAVRQDLARLVLVLRYWCTGAHFSAIDAEHNLHELQTFVESPEWRAVLAIALEKEFVVASGRTFNATTAYAELLSALAGILPREDRTPEYATQTTAKKSPDSGTAEANRGRAKSS